MLSCQSVRLAGTALLLFTLPGTAFTATLRYNDIFCLWKVRFPAVDCVNHYANREVRGMQCTMDHIVLNVENDEKMIVFYANVLMLESERLEEYRAGMVPFPSVRLNPATIIDLFPKKMWLKSSTTGQGRNNLHHFCISLEREIWEDLVERLKVNNVVIEEGPVPRWGAHGNGISIYFRDPEGNLIEARYYDRPNEAEKCLLGS